MPAYYNEIDPYAAQWLRNLVAKGLIAPGDVDERDIQDVKADDLKGYAQCHFFAGIGGWSYALRLAGWEDDRPIWTGSCPCQPFSAAGKGAGFADERHLWPAFYHLIRGAKPARVYGEQVGSSDGLVWIDLVQDDMEAALYAFGAFDLCAAGVGSPHIRQRLYWVADANGGNASAEWEQRSGQYGQQSQDGGACGLAVPESEQLYRPGNARQRRGKLTNGGLTQRVADDNSAGLEGHGIGWDGKSQWAAGPRSVGREGRGQDYGGWRADWLRCRDDKWRPVEPGTFPLANGVSNRVGKLRAYGNAIVPQVAAEFIKATM